MEESLKRLKKVRGSDRSSSNQGLSDDDKIRQQIILDIEELGKKVGVSPKWFCKWEVVAVDSMVKWYKGENKKKNVLI